MNSSSPAVAKKVIAPVKVKVEAAPQFRNAAGENVGGNDDPAVTPEPSVAGDGLSVDGFKKAIESKDKSAINVYRKVLSKSNKKMARKQDHSSRINPWNAHVAEFRKSHPTMKFKEILQQAKATYKK